VEHYKSESRVPIPSPSHTLDSIDGENSRSAFSTSSITNGRLCLLLYGLENWKNGRFKWRTSIKNEGVE